MVKAECAQLANHRQAGFVFKASLPFDLQAGHPLLIVQSAIIREVHHKVNEDSLPVIGKLDSFLSASWPMNGKLAVSL
jgi:hypothetical protein